MGFSQETLKFASVIFKRSIQIVGRSRSSKILAQLVEYLSPIVTEGTNLGEIKFYCPGKLSEWRARTLLTKEPETIEWIDTFKDGDVLWDVGANIGVYSLYAAKRDLQILAFEPSPSNYFLLNRNIEINRMDERIAAYCIAFTDITRADIFFMANTELGGALNSFGEATDWQGQPFIASFKQATIGFSIDDFIKQFDPPFPNHIKVDVDGIEDKIISGSKETLADSRLKSVLVELDTGRKEYCQKVTEILEHSGLRLFKKDHAADIDNGKFSKVYNHIFVKC